ncbi:MAG: UMP kinase [Bacilli bacterium]|nr:UMP kinase [Bacilli bacterium]
MAKYKRVLLKISGEFLAGEGTGKVLSAEILKSFAKAVKTIHDKGTDVAIVVGAGNIFRGREASEVGLERCNADYMGMLGTMINALALQDVLESQGLDTRVQTALEIDRVAEPYIRRKAISHLDKGRVIIFGGGTGNPFFSTDTTAALRAAEIGADLILMAKNGVEGVYDSDPRTNPNAHLFKELTYNEILTRDLKVMDNTAATLCSNNNIDIIVYNMADMSNIEKIIDGEAIGTHIRKE